MALRLVQRLVAVLGGVAIVATASWAQSASPPSAPGQGGPAATAASQPIPGAEVVLIRGKAMGFSAVSPALQAAIDGKYGKRVKPDPKSMGPNAHVDKAGFAYVSQCAENKKKCK